MNYEIWKRFQSSLSKDEYLRILCEMKHEILSNLKPRFVHDKTANTFTAEMNDGEKEVIDKINEQIKYRFKVIEDYFLNL